MPRTEILKQCFGVRPKLRNLFLCAILTRFRQTFQMLAFWALPDDLTQKELTQLQSDLHGI